MENLSSSRPSAFERHVSPRLIGSSTPASCSPFPDEESRTLFLKAAQERGAQLLRNFTLRRRLGLLPGGESGVSFSSFTSSANEGRGAFMRTSSPFSSSTSVEREIISKSRRVSASSVRDQACTQSSINAHSSSQTSSSEDNTALSPTTTTISRNLYLLSSSPDAFPPPEMPSSDPQSQTRRAELLRPFASLRLQLAPAAALALQQRKERERAVNTEVSAVSLSSSLTDGEPETTAKNAEEARDASPHREGGHRAVHEEEGTAKLTTGRTTPDSLPRERNESRRNGDRDSPALLSGDEEGRRAGGSSRDLTSLPSTRFSSRHQKSQDMSVERKDMKEDEGLSNSLPISCVSSPPCPSRSDDGDSREAPSSSSREKARTDVRETEGEKDKEILIRAMIIEEQRELISSLETSLDILRARIKELHHENEHLRMTSARGVFSLRPSRSHQDGLFPTTPSLFVPPSSRRKGGRTEAGAAEDKEEESERSLSSLHKHGKEDTQRDGKNGDATEEEEPCSEAALRRGQKRDGYRGGVYGVTKRKSEDLRRELGEEEDDMKGEWACVNEGEIEETESPMMSSGEDKPSFRGSGALIQKMELYRRELLQLCVENEQLRDLLRKRKEGEEEEATRKVPLRRYSSKEFKTLGGAHALASGVPDVADTRTYVLSRPQFGEVPPPLLM
ncbi:hypothetical protein CSUI_004459 [Cystoisospora suis]|uniref:Uncharacterized protein n=1 Tax=Cystoisospora suis TaxID=483139 RepID=A0A2C6KYQ3_9APIC|nr:hypothetical protein CSUI_004459 [Cystoisospora suis]